MRYLQKQVEKNRQVNSAFNNPRLDEWMSQVPRRPNKLKRVTFIIRLYAIIQDRLDNLDLLVSLLWQECARWPH